MSQHEFYYIQLKYNIAMSFIIEEPNNYLLNLKPNFHPLKTTHSPTNIRNCSNVEQTRQLFLKKIEIICNSNCIVTFKQNILILTVHIDKIFKHLSGIFIMQFNTKASRLSFSIKLLNRDNYYIRVLGKERMKLICKCLTNRLYQNLMIQLQLLIDPASGRVKFKSPVYILQQEITSNHIFRIIESLVKNFNDSFKKLQKPMEMIISASNDINLYYQPPSRNDNKNLCKHYDNLKRINILICFESEITNEENSLIQSILKQNQSIQSVKQNIVSLVADFSSSSLYFDLIDLINNQEDSACLAINSTQRQKIKQKIQLPLYQKSKNPNQSYYILNYIKTKQKLSAHNMKKVSSGGFTNIYVTEVEYWYVHSYCLGMVEVNQQECESPPHKKYLIIKRQNNDHLVDGQRSRIAHQKFILTKIKNGVSMFLCKYYILAQKVQSKENELLLDYIDYPDLAKYCIDNKESISMQTKIYLSIMIAQSLRYLKIYKIVHLDLKPKNIMTYKKLNIKLIDFGQSFHPELKNHLPGFSMPYSAPQNLFYPQTYNHKSDVFSLGVIMYQFFIGKFPYYIQSHQIRQKLKDSASINKYWFHCSQGNAIYGDSIVFPLLQSIIVKCLHHDPGQRPELEWIVYILRECLDYFY